jgi:outer membrane protein TolC
MKYVISILLIISLGLAPHLTAEETTPSDTQQLSLDAAIVQALENNLDLQIEIANMEKANHYFNISNSGFIPQFTANFSNSETNRPSTDLFSGADVNQSKTSGLELNLSQKLIIGGTFDVSLNNSRNETNSKYGTVNPSISSRLTFTLSQPLLKGFGTLAAKKDIYIACNDQSKSKYQLKEKILTLIYDVEEAYWNLVYAYQDLEAKKQALKRSQDLLKQNEIKVQVGTAAEIDILEAKAEVAADESQLIQADKNIQTSEERLKKILNLSNSLSTITPTDTPQIKPIELDFQPILNEALANRPEIQRAKLDLKNNQIQVGFYKNQMLPDLTLQANYYTTGLGGDQLLFEPGSSPFSPREPIGVIKKSIWESMQDTLSNLYKNYSISLKLTLPLSFGKEKAELAQAKVGMRQAELSYKNIENNVLSEVKEVIKEHDYHQKLVKANKIRLELESEKLKAEEKKLSVGLVSNYDVITKHRDYVNALSSALQSTISLCMTQAKINKILARSFAVYQIKFSDYINPKSK